MANTYVGTDVDANQRTIQDEFSYPANSFAVIYQFQRDRQNDAVTIHDIWGPGAPGSDYDNAPDGSRYTDITNSDLYIKSGAPGGGTSGSWVQA